MPASLNLAPLFLNMMAVALATAVMLVFFRLGNPHLRGVGTWALARLALAAGAAVHLVGIEPELRLLFLPGFLLIYLAFLLDYVGHCRFLGRSTGAWPGLLVGTVTIIMLMVIATAYGPLIGIILSLSMLAQILLITPTLLLLLRHRDPALRGPTLAVALPYLAWVIMPVARLILFSANQFQLGIDNGAVGPALVLGTTGLILQAIGMGWMIWTRTRQKRAAASTSLST
ncbi:hypothetical protein GE253_22400 [Niveispirillum sp. SYP-B3756]|uniref:hypothetical protein n=1 Tax=Niveispirillum sp. SYP-B3756 TaxID=2662178 RepID=UPI0012921A26|nr:hypothetical protein [Niveispirillum sp. SYP-B3756]MQP68073.1 hypothetical protein [Niveispirillum sp. SYP-B3756]